jgi:hypothetical protein
METLRRPNDEPPGSLRERKKDQFGQVIDVFLSARRRAPAFCDFVWLVA